MRETSLRSRARRRRTRAAATIANGVNGMSGVSGVLLKGLLVPLLARLVSRIPTDGIVLFIRAIWMRVTASNDAPP
jgi:hypothetical protein